jgi:putative hydrolase of HD superfamily
LNEKIAAKQIFGILDEPLQSEFYNLWIEFEGEETPDAIFACAIDRIMPFILNSNTREKVGQKPELQKSGAQYAGKCN